jgi:glycosyltransferase involved in cell wall biosynthesis
MKILLINKFLYPRGGDALCTLDTGRLLARNGHEVLLWGMSHPSNPTYRHNDLFIEHVDFDYSYGLLQRLRIATNLLYSYEAQQKIEELIVRERPDVVHMHNIAHQISPSILPVFHRHGIPVVMTLHDYKLVCASYLLLARGKICEACANGRYHNCVEKQCVKDSWMKSFLNTVEMYFHHTIRHIYDSVKIFVSPSYFLRDKLREMGFCREIRVLPHFINVDDYDPFYGSEEESIVYFGRLSHEKGLDVLLDATDEMSVQLKIIGDGPLRQHLEQRAAKRKMKNAVFAGYKTGAALHDEIRRAMCVVVPSEWYENSPRSILESFALGKPVIGSQIGGIPELVKDGETGWTFHAGDAHDLRSRILSCFSKKAHMLTMGKRARDFVVDKHNPTIHYDRLMSIYRDAMRL